jgi:hypothetical protein
MPGMEAYSAWRKAGELLFPCRVVGLALELLFHAESQFDLSMVCADHCSSVQFWATQHQRADGTWGAKQTCSVPVLPVHSRLALYLLRRLYVLIAGLGLVVKDAVVNRSRTEGTGHHDLVLKHAGQLAQGPFYCSGLISLEVKVAVAGPNGRRFAAAWDAQKERCAGALARVLRAPATPFGAAALLVVGICDDDGLLAPEPPVFAKMQLLTVDGSNQPKWGSILLDRGCVPVQPAPPPPRRQRVGRSWDEVRADLGSRQADIDGDGAQRVRLLDLFKAISASKTNKNLGQKLVTYGEHLGLRTPADYKRKRFPANQRGSEAVWLTWVAARRVYDYETRV